MRKLLFSLVLMFIGAASFAQGYTYVNGYTRSNGTYVQGHYRTLPNETRNDNWSTKGNVNPFTGVAGTKPGDYYPTYRNSYPSTASTPSTYNPSSSSVSSTYSSSSLYDMIMTTPPVNYDRTTIRMNSVNISNSIYTKSIYR